MICPLCNCASTSITYSGKIRNGAPGSLSVNPVDVYRCDGCGLIWHFGSCESANDYKSDSYRESMGETVSLSEFYAKHDFEILDKLNYTGTKVYRNKLFMDIGCGGGGYADYIRDVAQDVVLIEPNENFAKLLRSKGYEVFSYPEDALEKYTNTIDMITTYDVIEHVDNPQAFLCTIWELLTEGGVAYIGTPTQYPVLRSLLGAEFDSFVFSVQHPWVFSPKSLEILAEKAGFSAFEIKFYQRYGLGNLIAWLQQRKPLGEATFDFITPAMNAIYKSEMAKEKTAEYLVLELRK